MSNFKIIKYSDEYRAQLLEVWEKSVSATHDFLRLTDFESIKAFVRSIDFQKVQVFCLVKRTEVAGFIGIVDRKIEMLFLSPIYLGKGLGKKLVDFAIEELSAKMVDVNQQNIRAVGFYQKMGFKTYERTEKDDQGKDYPLFRMKL